MTATIPAGVENARDLVGPATAAAVERLSPEVRIVASYHLGLTDAEGRPPGRASAGKALRPALALLSARAAGAAPERGVPAAAAVEFVHNFSLLHDDIMDGDTERRHRPTAWTVYGVGRGDPGRRRAAGPGPGPAARRPGAAGPVGVALPGRGRAAADRRAGRGPGLRAPRRRHAR